MKILSLPVFIHYSGKQPAFPKKAGLSGNSFPQLGVLVQNLFFRYPSNHYLCHPYFWAI
jgi:hypothetical protein